MVWYTERQSLLNTVLIDQGTRFNYKGSSQANTRSRADPLLNQILFVAPFIAPPRIRRFQNLPPIQTFSVRIINTIQRCALKIKSL